MSDGPTGRAAGRGVVTHAAAVLDREKHRGTVTFETSSRRENESAAESAAILRVFLRNSARGTSYGYTGGQGP